MLTEATIPADVLAAIMPVTLALLVMETDATMPVETDSEMIPVTDAFVDADNPVENVPI